MTSIEWLIDQLEQKGDMRETPSIRNLQLNIDTSDYLELKRQAKEMHKQEIIDAAERWKGTDFAERYYQETFVSNFKQFSLYEHKETITSADTQVSKTFLESVPKQETLYTEEQVQKMIDDALTNYELGWADRRKQQNLYTEKEIRKAIYGNPKFIFGKDQAEAIIQSLKQPKKD